MNQLRKSVEDGLVLSFIERELEFRLAHKQWMDVYGPVLSLSRETGIAIATAKRRLVAYDQRNSYSKMIVGLISHDPAQLIRNIYLYEKSRNLVLEPFQFTHSYGLPSYAVMPLLSDESLQTTEESFFTWMHGDPSSKESSWDLEAIAKLAASEFEKRHLDNQVHESQPNTKEREQRTKRIKRVLSWLGDLDGHERRHKMNHAEAKAKAWIGSHASHS